MVIDEKDTGKSKRSCNERHPNGYYRKLKVGWSEANDVKRRVATVLDSFLVFCIGAAPVARPEAGVWLVQCGWCMGDPWVGLFNMNISELWTGYKLTRRPVGGLYPFLCSRYLQVVLTNCCVFFLRRGWIIVGPSR